MLRYCPLLRWRPHSTSSQHHFPHQAIKSDGYSGRHNGHFTAERERLCCGTMGLFREVALLLALLEPAFGLCSQRTFIRPSLVTDMMALCLPTATGHSVGMATIYPIEPSHRALSVAKDAGWAGRVKQLPSTILCAVMSQRQRSAIEQWQLTPFQDSKEKHSKEMGTKIHTFGINEILEMLCILPSLFSIVVVIYMYESCGDHFFISTICPTSKLSFNSFSNVDA